MHQMYADYLNEKIIFIPYLCFGGLLRNRTVQPESKLPAAFPKDNSIFHYIRKPQKVLQTAWGFLILSCSYEYVILCLLHYETNLMTRWRLFDCRMNCTINATLIFKILCSFFISKFFYSLHHYQFLYKSVTQVKPNSITFC